MIGAGRALREAREARGESLDEAAAALRVDARHLAALEAGAEGALPDGPFAAGWLRAYREHLGLPVDDEARHVPRSRRRDPERAPLWALRAVAGAAAIVAVLLAGIALLPGDLRSPPPSGPSPADADQHVTVHAIRTTGLRLLVDGAVVYDGALPGGERVAVDGRDRIEVHLTAAEAVRVDYNGERIEPQGRQDTPRRLVFVDDLGGEP